MVTIVRAKGFAGHFRAEVIVHRVPAVDGQGDLSVVVFGEGEITVVPARCVVRGLDLVKRFETDFDWQEDSWGVRHAFGGPFVFYGSKGDCRVWIGRKIA